MLTVARRHRLARLLAALAILLMTGLGQHVHTFGTIVPAGVEAMPAAGHGHAGDEGGEAVPSASHCGFCHLCRATMPGAEALGGPLRLEIAGWLPDGDLLPDLAVPDGPARPPRRERAV